MRAFAGVRGRSRAFFIYPGRFLYRHILCQPIDYRESFQDVKMLEDENKAIQSAQSPQVSVDYSDPFAVAEGNQANWQKNIQLFLFTINTRNTSSRRGQFLASRRFPRHSGCGITTSQLVSRVVTRVPRGTQGQVFGSQRRRKPLRSRFTSGLLYLSSGRVSNDDIRKRSQKIVIYSAIKR